MSKLAKFESKAEQWIEGAFGHMFGGRLQPLEVAGALARAMEDEQFTTEAGEHFAPNLYWVFLSPADYEALREAQPDLPVDLARSLIELAARANLRMPDQPIVEIRSDERIPRKQVSVAAQYVAQTTTPIGQTAEIAIDQLNTVRQGLGASSVQSFLILEGRRHVPLARPVVTIGARRTASRARPGPRRGCSPRSAGPGRNAPRLGLPRFNAQSTSGGSSDSDEKELIVSPTNAPLGARVVTTATPVGNVPSALRYSRASKVAAGGAAAASAGA